jgi:hypothetical protein
VLCSEGGESHAIFVGAGTPDAPDRRDLRYRRPARMPSRTLRSVLAAAAGGFGAVVFVWIAALLFFPDTAYEKVLTVMVVAAPAGAVAARVISRRFATPRR